MYASQIQADEGTISRLKSDVEYLCSPLLEGRNVPGKGGDLASKWLGDSFAEIGLAFGVSNSTYFQDFQLIQSKVDTILTTLTIYLPDQKIDLKWGTEFLIFPKKIANFDVETELAYAHYGIKSDDLKRDDFGENSRGKAALVLDGTGDLLPLRAGRHGMTPFKAVAARRAGAQLMVVLYADEMSQWPPESLQRKIADSKFPMTDLPGSQQEFLTIHINANISNENRGEGSNFSEDIFRAFAGSAKNNQIKLELNLVFEEANLLVGRNVIGTIKGKTDQYILVGAHYDHIGIKGIAEDGTLLYYPGADDNASGVSVILELSRLWKNREQAEHGLIIVAFGAEEDGMLGSRYFASNLPIPKNKIISMINLDMVGRNGFSSMAEVRQKNSVPDPDYAILYCSAASPELLSIANGVGLEAGLNLDLNPINSFRFSDAGPFNSIEIPSISIFSGFHGDYSELNDKPEFINWEKLAKMVLLTDNLLINFNKTDTDIIFDRNLKVKSIKYKY